MLNECHAHLMILGDRVFFHISFGVIPVSVCDGTSIFPVPCFPCAGRNTKTKFLAIPRCKGDAALYSEVDQ